MIISKIREVEAMDSKEKEYKELGCKDFGSDCHFMVRAETADEVINYCRQHACSTHNKCGASPEKVRSRIRTVRV